MSAQRTIGFAPIEVATETRKPAQVVDFVAWAKTAKKKAPAKKRIIGKQLFERAMRDLTEMIAKDDYTKARPLHLFALYCQCHAHTYGVMPVEIGPKDCKLACFAIGRALKSYFDGDVVEFVDFIRWTWRREAASIARKKANGVDNGFRIGVAYQCCAKLVTDFRVDLVKRS